MRRSRAAVGIGLLLTACADDGGTVDDPSGTAAETGPTTSSDTSSTITDLTTEATGTPATSTDTGQAATDSTGATGTADASSSGSSGGGGVIELANDSWIDGETAAFQAGFAQGECWASTYVPEAEHYPFTIRGVQMIVGGNDMGDAEFEVALWNVDTENRPSTLVDSGTALLSGLDDNWDGLVVDALMIDPPVVEQGNFAWVVCLVAHSGLPAIANDTDGAAADRNWIYTDAGEFVQSSGLGVSGDWIMRATIEPM
jgi:hypothetical protein